MKYDPDTAAEIRGIVIVARQQLDNARHALDASDEALSWLSEQLRAASVDPKPTTRWADNPQAAQIDALIERAKRLTDAEVDALSAAWDAARYAGAARYVAGLSAAWDAARYAGAARYVAGFAARGTARYAGAARYVAGFAARGTARYAGAARYVAWSAGAARYVAGFAAGFAALALVVRDLIDEATPWNQAAYDLITGPWAAVIGPAHPDDVQVDR